MLELKHIRVDAESQIIARVAKENLYTLEYAQGAMEEYKRFILMATKQRVCPSYVVDQVWHTHLLYTESYRTMCDCIGKVIDHKPNDIEEHTKSPVDEYQETLAFYKETFGEEPSDVYWSRRFPTKVIFVDITKYWIMPAGNTKFLIKLLFRHLKTKAYGLFRMVRFKA